MPSSAAFCCAVSLLNSASPSTLMPLRRKPSICAGPINPVPATPTSIVCFVSVFTIVMFPSIASMFVKRNPALPLIRLRSWRNIIVSGCNTFDVKFMYGLLRESFFLFPCQFHQDLGIKFVVSWRDR